MTQFHKFCLERRSVCREELLKNAPTLLRGGVFRPLCFRSLLEIGALVSVWSRQTVKPFVALGAFALSLIPSLAVAEQSAQAWAHKRVQEGLVNALVQQDNDRSRFSRVVQPPRERRLRILAATTSFDKQGREFMSYQIDVRYGDEWHSDVVGCVYRKSGKIFVQLEDEYRPAEFLLGKNVGPVSGVCEAKDPPDRA